MTKNKIVKMEDGDYDDDEISLNESFDCEDFNSDPDFNDEDLRNMELELQVPKVKTVANIMNKILSSKQEGPATVLSKDRKKDEKSKDDESDSDEEEEEELRKKRLEKKKEKLRLMNMGRVIPKQNNNRELERKLRTIATQGVVQLFGAINKHKVELRNELKEAKSSVQRDKAYANKGLDNFLTLLDKEGQKFENNSTELSSGLKQENGESVKLENGKEPKSRWNALAQDFYQEPELNDWDKCDSDEG